MAEQTPPKEQLVGDLQTLVTLLEEGKDPTPDLFADDPVMAPAPEPSAQLEKADVVDREAANQESLDEPLDELPSEPLEETLAANSSALATIDPPVNSDLFDALLGSGWESQSNALVQAASESIQAQQLDWNPEDTEALTEALQVRLQQSINGWLNTTLAEQVQQLRAQLLSDLQQELTERVQQTLDSNRAQREQKEDGLSKLAQDPAQTGTP